MSLESKIDALTKAVEALTAVLTAQSVAPAPTTAPKAETSAPAPEPKSETPTALKTHDELQTMLLMKVRDNLDNRPKIAEILNSYNAKKIGDLTSEQVQTAYPLIEAL